MRLGLFKAALRSGNPLNSTWKDWIPILRCTIASWVGLILVIDNTTIRVLGQASFLVLIVSTANPPAGPVVKVIYESIYSLIFVCGSWFWYVLASRAATAARTHVYSQSSLRLPDNDNFDCGSTPQQCFVRAIFAGEFIEGRSSIIYALFFFFGSVFFFYVKVKYPARIFAVIFGQIALIIPHSYGPLFPYWYPELGQVLVNPIGCQVAINVACAVLIWPETMNYVYINQIRALLGNIKALAQTQQCIIACNPQDLDQWSSHAGIKDEVRNARKGLSAFAMMEECLVQEIQFGRLAAPDLREITQLCRDVCLKLGGFSMFYDHVTAHMQAHESCREKGIRTPAHEDDEVLDEKHSSEYPSTPHSGAATPDRQQTQHLKPEDVHDHLRLSMDSSKRKHKHAHFKKNNSRTNLLYEALHHQYKPVGTFEMHQYDERESRFPQQAEVDFLRRMMSIVSQSSTDLFAAVHVALDANCEYLQVVNEDRFVSKLFHHRSKDMEETLTLARDNLQRTWDEFQASGRLKMLEPYDQLDTNDYFGKTPHRPLLRMYYLEFHLMRFSYSLLLLTQKCLDLEIDRKSPRWRWPTVCFGFNLVKQTQKKGIQEAQDEDEEGLLDNDDDIEVRDPDHEPPRHIGHLAGGLLVQIGKVLKNPAVAWAIKASVLLVILAIPSYLRRSAGWFYRHRGLWVLTIATLTQAPFTGDTVFAFVWRVIGTFLGALLALMTWYIGNGNGQGQPFGFAAVMAVALPIVLYIRLKFVYINIQPAIILVLTFALILGYSWQDSHLPSTVNLGVGWNIAWRRFVNVMIGITATFIWTFVPKPTTSRQVIRKRLATGITDIGNIFVHVSNYARSPHRRKADEETIRQMVVRANGKLLLLNQRMLFVDFEPPLQGPWPKEKYIKLMNLQQDMLDLMVAFVNNLTHMEASEWVEPLLRRSGWYDRTLMGDCLAVLYMIAHAIRTGGALPQLVPSPLLDRFTKRMNLIQQTKAEGALPSILTHETFECPGYAGFAVGNVISFGMVHRIDQLMNLAKELVGERWHSTNWDERELDRVALA